MTFEIEKQRLKEIFEKNSMLDKIGQGNIDNDLDAFLEEFNEKAQNYVKENRGEFGLRSESDSPVGT